MCYKIELLNINYQWRQTQSLIYSIWFMKLRGDLFPRLMFSKDLEDTDIYVLIVSCRDRYNSCWPTASLITPIPILLNQWCYRKIQLLNEINIQANKYGNCHCWLSILFWCWSILHRSKIILRGLSMVWWLFISKWIKVWTSGCSVTFFHVYISMIYFITRMMNGQLNVKSSSTDIRG